jgi:tetratricopeptide (TPR) repeat protein
MWMRAAADAEDAGDKHPVTPGPVLPARELLGDMLMEASRPHEALAAYEAALKDSPNRFNSLWGAGRAAWLLNDPPKALAYFRQLEKLCEAADTDRRELTEARAYLARGNHRYTPRP